MKTVIIVTLVVHFFHSEASTYLLDIHIKFIKSTVAMPFFHIFATQLVAGLCGSHR